MSRSEDSIDGCCARTAAGLTCRPVDAQRIAVGVQVAHLARAALQRTARTRGTALHAITAVDEGLRVALSLGGEGLARGIAIAATVGRGWPRLCVGVIAGRCGRGSRDGQ